MALIKDEPSNEDPFLFLLLRTFLGFYHSWNGTIVVGDEAGAVLHRIKPGHLDQTAKELNLVQSEMVRSSTFETELGWATLFKSLATQLKEDEAEEKNVLELVSGFFDFLKLQDEAENPEIPDLVSSLGSFIEKGHPGL